MWKNRIILVDIGHKQQVVKVSFLTCSRVCGDNKNTVSLMDDKQIFIRYVLLRL